MPAKIIHKILCTTVKRFYPHSHILNHGSMDLPYVQVPDTLVMMNDDVLSRLDDLVQSMFANGAEAKYA